MYTERRGEIVPFTHFYLEVIKEVNLRSEKEASFFGGGRQCQTIDKRIEMVFNNRGEKEEEEEGLTAKLLVLFHTNVCPKVYLSIHDLVRSTSTPTTQWSETFAVQVGVC